MSSRSAPAIPNLFNHQEVSKNAALPDDFAPTGKWVDIGDVTAREKVGHAIRDTSPALIRSRQAKILLREQLKTKKNKKSETKTERSRPASVMPKVKKQETKAKKKTEQTEREAAAAALAPDASGMKTVSPTPSTALCGSNPYFREFLQLYLEHQEAIDGASSSDGRQDRLDSAKTAWIPPRPHKPYGNFHIVINNSNINKWPSLERPCP